MLKRRHALVFFFAASWVSLLVACSSTSDGPKEVAGTPDAAIERDSAAPVDAAPRPAPVFLDPSVHADWFSMDAAFPYAVTRVHAVPVNLSAPSWGQHGGPLSNELNADGKAIGVRWTLPQEPVGAPLSAPVFLAPKTGFPDKFFWGVDGLRDTPFGLLSVHSYSTSAAAFAGEVLFYAPGTTEESVVAARAHVNAYYSGVGVSSGTKNALVYAGFSPVSASPSSVNESGMYVAPICDMKLVGVAGCAAPAKLFGWKGASGPVAADALGHVFVAASESPKEGVSDVLYGLTRDAAMAGVSLDAPAHLAETNFQGTASLAALAPEGAAKGWLLGQSFAAGAPVYAVPYQMSGTELSAAGPVLGSAIVLKSTAKSIVPFSDADGDLWLAVNVGIKGYFVELRRKP